LFDVKTVDDRSYRSSTIWKNRSPTVRSEVRTVFRSTPTTQAMAPIDILSAASWRVRA
jgi:hypothetical protein